MKKLWEILCMITLLLCTGTQAFAATNPTITVGKVTAEAGESVDVPISISNNTGICGATISVSYDEDLVLTAVNGGDAFTSMTLTKPGKLTANPVNLVWDSMEADFTNGTIAVLTFTVPETSGTYDVSVSYDNGGVVDGDLMPVTLNVVNGSIAVEEQGSAAVVAKGYSGATQWTLTDDGIITFYGKGNMKNYEYSGGQPWKNYADKITAVVIEEGVTSVGQCAFKDLTNLKTVTLPETGLNKIGEAAFYGCSSLESLYIPEGVYTVWEYTFKNCTGLKSIRLPKTLVKIDQGAFENCTGLTELFMPTNVNIIGAWSFKACTGLKSVDMQWTDATEIRDGAFKNCTALTEIILPGNIQNLGDSCFYGIGATKFVVPATVTEIEAWCFARSSVKEIVFEGDAPVIGTGAFNKITLTAYYNSGNATWTSDIMQNYGGTMTWKAN